MPEVVPFAALRYATDRSGPLADVTAPPYDVISPAQERDLLARSPYNVVRIEGAADGGDDGDHRAAADFLSAWRADGVLVSGPASLFAYEMAYAFGGEHRVTRGILGALRVEPWGGGVLPHEATSAKPLGERLGRLRTVRANVSPIHVVLPGPSPVLGRSLEHVAARPPIGEVTDDEGVRHRLWELDADPALGAELAAQRCMIADGHHRYTTALAYREEMRAAHGEGPWDHVLAFVGDADGTPVLPFHRVVLAGDVPEPDVATSSLEATLAALDDDRPRVGVVRPVGADDVAYGLIDLPGAPPAVEALEPRLPSGEDAVRFTPDAREAVEAVRTRAALGAWLLPPTSAARVRTAVDAGRRLPRKSTYFWPKPRTGFVLRPFD